MMKKVLMVTLALLACSMIIPQGLSWFFFRPAIVSTDMLEWNLNRGNLVVLDVRDGASYGAGHIPGAINVEEAEWYVNDPFVEPPPWMEMPPAEDLFELIGDAGITRYTWVVVVGSTSGSVDPMLPLALYAVAGATRVAMALLYAGVKYVSILDGGYDKWVADGKEVSTDAPTPDTVTYEGPVDDMLVSADYVLNSAIGESIIVDARDEFIYDGTACEPWAPCPPEAECQGHIPTARNLPAPTLWNIEIDEENPGNAKYITYKNVWTLSMMAFDAVGRGGYFKEVIVYCGVGGYASTAYFVLSEVLGYRNVRVFDGSAQEWCMLGNEFVY